MEKFNQDSALLLKMAIDSGIADPEELGCIMGNASVETKQYSTMHEDFRYRSVDKLLRAVSSATERYTRQQIQDAIDSKDPVRIATVMYEGRNTGDGGLGNSEPGDGWRFHGRGFFQYTGRENYTKFGKMFDVDLVNNPEIAAEPVMAAKLAIAYWEKKVPEHSRRDAVASGMKINGGNNGEVARFAASERWKKTITPKLVKDIQAGKITLDQLSFHGWDALKDGKLKRNERGMEIRELQHHLNALSIPDAKGRALNPNGTFDKPTQEAVETFQRQLGMPPKSPVTADTLNAAAFYAGAPEILRKPLQPAPPSELPEAFRETAQPLAPPGAAPQYRNDWLPRDAEGRPNFLHSRAAPEQAVAPEVNPVQAQLMQLQREVEALRQQRQPEFASRPELEPGLPAAPSMPDYAAVPSEPRTVAHLQSDLIQLGYHHRVSQPLQVNGVNDDATRQAVTAFQAQHELPISGSADLATQQVVQQALLAQQLQQQGVDAREREAEHDRTAERSAQSLPFSHPNHPQHALYADVDQRFQAKGHDLSEGQLSVLTGQMHLGGYKPGWQGDVAVYGGQAMVGALSLGFREMDLKLDAPVPSVQETMQAFQTQQQSLAEHLDRMNQQQAQSHSRGLS